MKTILIYKTVLVFSLLAFTGGLMAQAPGMMGKTVSLHYDFVLTPGLGGRVIPYDAAEKKERSIANYIRYRHEVELEIAISRKTSFSTYYLFHRGGYASREVNYIFGNATQSGGDVEYYNPDFSRNFVRHGVGISIKKYAVNLLGYSSDEGAIAPLGFYWGPKAFVSFDRYEIKANSDLLGGQNRVFASRELMHYGGAIKTGRHILLFDKVMFDIGFEIGFLALNNKVDTLVKEVYPGFIISDPLVHPFEHISLNHFFGIHLGIGYPLF